MQDIEITFDDLKAILPRLVLLIFFSILFLFTPFREFPLMFFEMTVFAGFPWALIYIVMGLLFISFLLFVLMDIVFVIVTGLKKKPALILTKAGIVDNSRFFSIGLVPWSSIKAVNSYRLSYQTYVVLSLLDFKAIIDKQHVFKKIILYWRTFLYGSPIKIYAFDLKYKFYDLVKLIEETWQANQ